MPYAAPQKLYNHDISQQDMLRLKNHPNNKKDWNTCQEIDDNFKAAYLGMQQLGLHRKWGIYDDYWAGDQNPVENEDDPASVTNIIHPVIESQVADLADTPIDFLIRGVEPSDEEWAKYVQFICKWIWDQNKMQQKLDQHERQRMKYGSGVWKVYFDPLGNKGLGSICIDVVSPEKLLIDPKVTSPLLIQQADFMVQPTDTSLKQLIRRFGKRAKFVRPRKRQSMSVNLHKGEEIKEATGIANNSATLYEYWCRDDEDRLRLVYKADDVILWDSAWSTERQKKESPKMYSNPESGFYEHGMYPYVVTPCYLRDGQVWGMGDVELLIPVQDLINDLDDQIRMNARLMGNIQIIVGLASGINPAKWTNKGALRIPARDPDAWRIVQPVAMPAYIQDRRELGKREAELISGRTDVVEGRKPAGIKAASAIIALQEAGNRRVNHKKLMGQVGLSDAVYLAFEHFREHFTQTMAIRVTGEKPSDPDQFVWMRGTDFNNVPKLIPDLAGDPNDLGELPLKQAVKRTYDGDGNVTSEEPQTKRAVFDYLVSVGAGLPKNKSFLYQAGIELHREQIVTTEEARQFFKEMLDWPLIDPFNPTGMFSQNKPELGPDGHPIQPPMQPGGGEPGMGGLGGGVPQGMNPALMQALSGILGGVG